MDKLLNEFSFGLFIWQTVLFLALIFLLKRYAWGPILNAVNEREDSIKDALAGADKARQEMQNLKSDNEKILKEARAERDILLKEAKELKENIISEAKDEAQTQANKIIEQAKATIQNEKVSAIAEMKNQMGNISISIAEKIVKGELSNKDKQIQLVENMLKEVTLN
jgi:F-type H+-transporting ATPase subunit b